MQVALTYTGRALEPLDAHDAETLKQAFGVGEIVATNVTKGRNVRHHRLFFGLMQTVLANQDKYRTMQDLLVEVKLRAGWYDEHVTADGVLVYVPRSIAFDKCDQIEFNEIFRKAVVALAEICPGVGDVEAIADDLIAKGSTHQ